MDRVWIFIDGSNFYHALKEASLPVRVDLGKLGVNLTGEDRRHTHTYYYNAPLIRPRRDDRAATTRCTTPRISAAVPSNGSSTRSASSPT